jgi:hypothetical protein
MTNKYFYPHIPPSWISAPVMKKVAGSSFQYSSDLFPESPDSPKNAKFNFDDVLYKINTLGYREEEFKDSYFEFDELILGFGHSTTAGVAIPENEIYLRIVEKSLPNVRVLNFGIPKASPDTVARMVSCVVPYFIDKCKKLSCIIMWPQDVRREVFLDNFHENVTAFSDPPYDGYFYGIDKTSSKYNRDKNKHIVELVTTLHSIEVYTVPWKMYDGAVNDKHDKARDGVSPSTNWHKKFAEEILNQMKLRSNK